MAKQKFDFKEVAAPEEEVMISTDTAHLSNCLKVIHEQNLAQTELLKKINSAAQIIGVIVLLSAILAACGALLGR